MNVGAEVAMGEGNVGRVTCEVSDCFRPPRRGGMCWTHYRRRLAGASVSAPILERRIPWEALLDAFNGLIEAMETGTEHDERLAKRRLTAAIDRLNRGS